MATRTHPTAIKIFMSFLFSLKGPDLTESLVGSNENGLFGLPLGIRPDDLTIAEEVGAYTLVDVKNLKKIH